MVQFGLHIHPTFRWAELDESKWTKLIIGGVRETPDNAN